MSDHSPEAFFFQPISEQCLVRKSPRDTSADLVATGPDLHSPVSRRHIPPGAKHAQHRAAWRERHERELAEHLYMARGLVQELAADGRWDQATVTAIQAAIENAARVAGVGDAFDGVKGRHLLRS